MQANATSDIGTHNLLASNLDARFQGRVYILNKHVPCAIAGRPSAHQRRAYRLSRVRLLGPELTSPLNSIHVVHAARSMHRIKQCPII